jgi:hypothetical protein
MSLDMLTSILLMSIPKFFPGAVSIDLLVFGGRFPVRYAARECRTTKAKSSANDLR